MKLGSKHKCPNTLGIVLQPWPPALGDTPRLVTDKAPTLGDMSDAQADADKMQAIDLGENKVHLSKNMKYFPGLDGRPKKRTIAGTTFYYMILCEKMLRSLIL